MNIIISNYDSVVNPHYSGGGAVAVHEIGKRLSNDHNVKLISGTFKGTKDNKIDNVVYDFVGLSLFGPKLGHIFYQLGVMVKAFTEKYDLWIEGSTPPTTFSLLPLISKNKVLSWVHMFAGSDMHRKYKIPFQFVEKKLAQNYQRFIVLSDWAKNKVKNDFRNTEAEIVTIPNGLSVVPGEINPGINTENYLLFLGRLEINQKGLDLLISAFKNVDAKEGVKLVIVGEGSKNETKRLSKMIENYNLSDRVKVLGRKEGKEKEKLLANSLALVLPSRFDTYPLVVLEAFSHTKPVILFDLPQLSWVPNNASYKVECFDVRGFANACNKVLRDDVSRLNMGKNAYEFASKSTWDNVYKYFSNFIANL